MMQVSAYTQFLASGRRYIFLCSRTPNGGLCPSFVPLETDTTGLHDVKVTVVVENNLQFSTEHCTAASPVVSGCGFLSFGDCGSPPGTAVWGSPESCVVDGGAVGGESRQSGTEAAYIDREFSEVDSPPGLDDVLQSCLEIDGSFVSGEDTLAFSGSSSTATYVDDQAAGFGENSRPRSAV